MRHVFSMSVAILAGCMAAPSAADIPDTFTNLRVLPQSITKQELTGTMRSFTSALGVRCDYCHLRPEGDPDAELDFASDARAEKETARVMMRMVRSINTELLPAVTTKHPDRVEVQCRTCHHGQARPRLIEDVLSASWHSGGIDSVAAGYERLRKQYYGSDSFNFSERMLPALGERLAGREHPEEILEFAELNLTWFPDSGFAHLVRGQLRARLGQQDAALEDLQKAIELDPGLREPAERVIRELEKK